MNESYLNRKIFSKLKRTRTQPSNQSLSSATSRAQDSHSDDDDDHHQQQQQPDQDDQHEPEAARSKGEAPTGQEEEEDKIRTRGEPKRAESTAGSVSPPDSQPSTSCSGDQTTSDNLLFVNGGHHHNSRGHPEPQSKLRTRSRAVWLFIRAASSLTSSTNASQDNNAASASRVGRRLGSLAPRMRHSSSCTASASNLNGDEQPAGATCLPRFIVPKMNALNLPIVCLVKSLEGELMREVFVHRYELGQYLIDSLKASLGLKDSKYFGLKMAKSLDDQEDVRQPWLDLNESICKQISKQKVAIVQAPASSGANPTTTTTAKSICFYLRIKFYPPNLARIQDAFLRRYLWLQLRRDLRLGKLTSSMNNLTLLMACVLQHELGDYQADLVERLPELNILPNQDLIEEQAIEVWKTRLINSKKHQVLMQFLRAAVILETYGFDYYPVRDHQRQRAYLLGFNYNGIKTIRNGRIIHHFRWHSLNKVSYERRMIIFHIYPTENSKRKQILGFKCLSNDDCQNLYMRLLEQKYFFTVDLTYFDKSVRRPSCLEASQSAVALDWSAVGSQSEEHQRQQQQQQQRFGSTSNSIGDFNTTQSHLNGSFDQDVELDQTNFDDDDEEEEEDDHHHYDGQEQRNGCDCDDYDLAGDYRNHRASTATSNWPQSSATSGHHDHHHFQHHSQRASFSRPSAHNNNNNNLDAAGQAGSLHRSPIPTDGQHGQSNNETRHLYGPANFTKSSSLQEQSSQRAPPLGAKEGQQNNGTLTLFSSPEGEPAPGAPGPPPAPNQQQQQQLPVPISSHQIRHHHQAEPDGSHAPLQRQHSTLVYAGASINRPSWQALAGHANSKPGRDQIDLDDKNNTPVEEGDDDGPRQQSGQAAGGEGQPSGGLLDNLLASLLVVVGGGGGGGADLASPSGGQQREGAQQQESMILLAVRFCLLILLMNFLLRLTDGLSGALVDLLTIPGRGGGGSGAPTGNVAD